MVGTGTYDDLQLPLDPRRHRFGEGTRHEAPAETAKLADATGELVGVAGGDAGCRAQDPPQILSPFAAFQPFTDTPDESLDSKPSVEDKAMHLNTAITNSSKSQIKRHSSGPLQLSADMADTSHKAELPAQKCAISNAGLSGVTALRAASMPYNQNKHASKVTIQINTRLLRGAAYHVLLHDGLRASDATYQDRN